MIKGEIVLLPFPFDDLSATKVRPAVCLTEPVGEHRHLVVAFISSQIPTEPLDTDIVLRRDAPGFVVTGLRTDSVIRLHRLMTINVDLIRRELGRLPESLLIDIAERLRRFFGL